MKSSLWGLHACLEDPTTQGLECGLLSSLTLNLQHCNESGDHGRAYDVADGCRSRV